MKLKIRCTDYEKNLFIHLLNGEKQIGTYNEECTRYKEIIDKMMNEILNGKANSFALYIDFMDLIHIKDPKEVFSLQEKILSYPLIILDILNYWYAEYLVEIYGESILKHQPFTIRLINSPQTEINAFNLHKFNSLEITITDIGLPQIMIDVAKYRCSKCHMEYLIYQPYLDNIPTPKCLNKECSSNWFNRPTMLFLNEASTYVDFQYMKGRTKSNLPIHLFVTNDLVSQITDKNTFICSGILTSMRLRLVEKIRLSRKQYNKYKKQWDKEQISPGLEPILIVNSFNKIKI